MARIRTIHPRFPRSASMCRVTRDARLLFIQLWLVADDAGRLPLNTAVLIEELYPVDEDAAALLPSWLDELEREGCVERYGVEGRDYLRIVKWRKHQTIDRPTSSVLPGAPREARERGDEESPRSRKARALPDDPREETKKEKDETPVIVTKDGLLRMVDDIRVSATADGSYSNALRSVAMLAELGRANGKPKDPAASPHGPPISVLHGLKR